MSERIQPALTPKRRVTPPEVRFEAKVERITESGCWVWMGNIDRKGYGHFYDGRVGRQVLAHRWSYEHFRHPIPDGLTLDHLCRVRSCVNPVHLEPVTDRENTLRSPDTVATLNASKQTCPHGHEYAVIVEGGRKRRRCPECQRGWVRVSMRRRRSRA